MPKRIAHSKNRPLAWYERNTWCVGLIVSSALVVYANSLAIGFVFDDRATVIQNTSIRDLSSLKVLAPDREVPTAGRPLANVSHALNFAFGGLNPAGYHVVNLALHCVCAILLFLSARLILATPRPPESVRRQSSLLALISTLLWTIHPLNSEVVDYVTQRSESMMAACFLATVMCSVRSTTARSPGWTRAAVLFCALGMLCKESMVVVPAIVILIDGVFLFDTIADAFRRRWRFYAALCATWLVLAILVASAPRGYSAGFGAGVSPWTYLLNQSEMIVQYLRLTIWPNRLVVAYGPVRPLDVSEAWPYLVSVVCLIGLTIAALLRWRLIGFVGAFFFITLAPTTSLVPIVTEVGAERRMYLPSAALIAALVILGAAAIERVTARHARKALAAVCVLLAIVLAGTTIRRNAEYVDPIVLSRTVLDRWPTPFAHAIVGTQLAIAGRHDEAIAQLREAVPGYPLARFHLGGELFNRGSLEEALPLLQAFIAEKPLLAEAVPARLMIGRIQMKHGSFAEAIGQFEQVLTMTAKSSESNVTALGFLADSLFADNQFEAAINRYQAYIESRPADVGAYINIGVALAQVGRPADAVRAFERALLLDPKNETARNNIAIAQQAVGR